MKVLNFLRQFNIEIELKEKNKKSNAYLYSFSPYQIIVE